MSATHRDRWNASLWALAHKPFVLFMCFATLILGIFAYFHLGQSEDPPFTFKVMVIRSYLPGTSAKEIEQQLTDRIEKKLQEVPYLDWIRSYSKPGESLIFLAIKDSAPPAKVSETWYQVRKKIGDIQHQLPSGVQGPFFNDEFGDTYVHIFALLGKGMDMATLKHYADRAKQDMIRLPGITKIDMLGEQEERIYIEISNTRLANLGIAPDQVLSVLQKFLALPAQAIFEQRDERVVIRLKATESWDQVGELIFYSPDHKHAVKLKDIATIHRGWAEPPAWTMHFQGEPIVGLGIVMMPGHSVVELGKALEGEKERLQKELPLGIHLETVTSMPRAVSRSVSEFVRSLFEAVAIVLVISLISLGLRAGFVVALSIPIVLAGTFALMHAFDIGLHKISLGALILSLGLLVDDAIIAVESMLVKIEQGWGRVEAAGFAFRSTAFPMLTGTLITILGFLPIATAQSATGEYTRSIFQVTAIALILSWLIAVIVIPYLGYYFIKAHKKSDSTSLPYFQLKKIWLWLWGVPAPTPELAKSSVEHESNEGSEADIYHTSFYRYLRAYIARCVHYRKRTLLITLLIFGASIVLFKHVPQQFFPDSSRPELLVDMKLADGSSYYATSAVVNRFDGWLAQQSGIENRVCYVGNGSPRFYLPLDQQLPNPAFAQCVILTHGKADRERLKGVIMHELSEHYPALRGRVSRLENGPPVGFPVQFRVSGEDHQETRRLANEVATQLRASPLTKNVQLDWDEPIKAIHIRLDLVALQRLGLSPQDVGILIRGAFQGVSVSALREGIESSEVIVRAPINERVRIDKLAYLMIPVPHGKPVPLLTVAQLDPILEEAVIWRRNRLPTFTVRSDVRDGLQGADVAKELDREIDILRERLPLGYRIEVGGVIEDSSKGQSSIAAGFPLMLLMVFSLLLIQLNRFSRVFMVLVTAPLGLIGVALALLLFGMPFGFVAMLGTIALSGIIMRNTLILVDQIDQDVLSGAVVHEAVIDATIRRFRPICLTALAAVLGLVPLSRSDFFGPMAVAMMGGIVVATLLTIIVVPALYACCVKTTKSAV